MIFLLRYDLTPPYGGVVVRRLTSLPARASEQGNVIGSVHMCTKKIAIERTRVIQCSPSYSAVSALLTNPIPDRSNYSPLLPHPLPHSI